MTSATTHFKKLTTGNNMFSNKIFRDITVANFLLILTVKQIQTISKIGLYLIKLKRNVGQ